MTKEICQLAVLANAWLLASATPVAAGAIEVPVFQGGKDGYPVYRIPTIVRAANNDLLAIVEARESLSDTGDIDLVYKRSSNNGRTWGPLKLIADQGNKTAGNPAPVVDTSTGRIHLLFSIDQNSVRVITSDDNGTTWNPPTVIHDAVSGAGWKWHVPGPVHGIELQRGPHAGRLLVPSDHINADGRWGAHVIYSDDHGESWKLGAVYDDPGNGVIRPNENVAVELVDGRIYFNSRDTGTAPGTRSIAYSSDGGQSYSGPFVAEPNLSTPIVQNSVIRFSAADAGDQENLLIYSSPGNPSSRRDMTIRVSNDEGVSWAKDTIIHPGPAAYSDLIKLDADKVGVLFEAGENLYDKILFSYLDVADLDPTPWNGIHGDVNQDGAFNTLDIDAFVAAWNSPLGEVYFGGSDSYIHGDLNFDGRKDLLDVFELRTSLLGANLPSSALDGLVAIPEPCTSTLLAPSLLVALYHWSAIPWNRELFAQQEDSSDNY